MKKDPLKTKKTKFKLLVNPGEDYSILKEFVNLLNSDPLTDLMYRGLVKRSDVPKYKMLFDKIKAKKPLNSIEKDQMIDIQISMLYKIIELPGILSILKKQLTSGN